MYTLQAVFQVKRTAYKVHNPGSGHLSIQMPAFQKQLCEMDMVSEAQGKLHHIWNLGQGYGGSYGHPDRRLTVSRPLQTGILHALASQQV